MAWKERSYMDERVLLVSEYLRGEQSMAELCRAAGVSRKTAYKWVTRYRDEGPSGLEDRSRAPHTHPSRIEPVDLEALVQARRAHQHWGARKILARLNRKQPEMRLPAASTVNSVFGRYGLSRAQSARRRTPPYTDPFADADVPNRVWCADFKGDFRTGDGNRCYPLTITDACSRMLLCCTGLRSTKTAGAQPIFEAAFRDRLRQSDRVRSEIEIEATTRRSIMSLSIEAGQLYDDATSLGLDRQPRSQPVALNRNARSRHCADRE